MTWFEYVEKNDVKVKDITNAIGYIKACNHYSNKYDHENELELLKSKGFREENITKIKRLSHKAD